MPELVVSERCPRAMAIPRIARHPSENGGKGEEGKDGAAEQDGDQAFVVHTTSLASLHRRIERPRNGCVVPFNASPTIPLSAWSANNEGRGASFWYLVLIGRGLV